MSLVGERSNARIRFTTLTGASTKTYDFELDEMRIYEEHENYTYVLADDTTEAYQGRFFLHYRLDFRRMKRVETGVESDLLDLLNDFRNRETTVRFYPVYDIDDTLNYVVRLDQERTDLARFDRGMQRYGTRLELVNTAGIDTLPAALRATSSITLNNIEGAIAPDV